MRFALWHSAYLFTVTRRELRICSEGCGRAQIRGFWAVCVNGLQSGVCVFPHRRQAFLPSRKSPSGLAGKPFRECGTCFSAARMRLYGETKEPFRRRDTVTDVARGTFLCCGKGFSGAGDTVSGRLRFLFRRFALSKFFTVRIA